EGKFVATAASTMLSYAEAAVLVYDYLNGLDFAEQLGSEIEFPTYVATSTNADEHLHLSHCVERIDWRTFSKVHNQRLERYAFTLSSYIEAAKGCVWREE